MDNSSIDFVIEIFIKPIRRVLLRSDIFQNSSMDFYFSNFADAIALALSEKMKIVHQIREKNILDQPISYFYKNSKSDFWKMILGRF